MEKGPRIQSYNPVAYKYRSVLEKVHLPQSQVLLLVDVLLSSFSGIAVQLGQTNSTVTTSPDA